MGSFSKVVFVLGVGILLGACEIKFPKEDKVEADPVKLDFKLPDIDLNFADLYPTVPTCDKTDQEQAIPAEVAENKAVLKDVIETQDFEEVDCDGKVIQTGRGPVRDFLASIVIPAPENLDGKLNTITVENARTCDQQTVVVLNELSDQKFSHADKDGQIKLFMQVSNFKALHLFMPLSVHDHNNLMKVTYSECVKTKIDPESKKEVCEEYRPMATREVLVDVQIDRPEIAGKRTVKKCDQPTVEAPSNN